MEKNLHFLIIDDDPLCIDIYKKLLEKAGHTVSALTSSTGVLEKILKAQPDCVLCDLMMPNFDALALFQKLRAKKVSKQPAFIIISTKNFENDRKRALDLGVDSYLTKPINPDTFVEELLEIILGVMIVQFWGIRGTIPVPGPKTVRYGGNTNCVTLTVAKKHFFIFDAGTGIKELSNYLVKQNMFPLSAKIFISHPHYDHIEGLPFLCLFLLRAMNLKFWAQTRAIKKLTTLSQT